MENRRARNHKLMSILEAQCHRLVRALTGVVLHECTGKSLRGQANKTMMKLPDIPAGESFAYHLYRHYYWLSDEEKAEFYPALLLVEWSAMRQGKFPEATLEDAKALVDDNIAYSRAREDWFFRTKP
jgi:hypothetical protein